LSDLAPDRWAGIVEVLVGIPEEFVEKILAHLDEIRSDLVDRDDRAVVWAAVRARLYLMVDEDEKPRRVRMSELYESLTPKDVVRSTAWLFDLRPHLPSRLANNWRDDEARREQLRRDAVARVMADADWMSLLERLIAEVEVAGTLGY